MRSVRAAQVRTAAVGPGLPLKTDQSSCCSLATFGIVFPLQSVLTSCSVVTDLHTQAAPPHAVASESSPRPRTAHNVPLPVES